MKLSRLLFLSLITLVNTNVYATEPDTTTTIVKEISNQGNIVVDVPDALLPRLMPSADKEQTTDEQTTAKPTAPTSRSGYRILVYEDNNVRTAKHSAQARRQQVAGRFPEFRTYLEFNSPYWRVKLGDFKTRSEAQSALTSIRQAFPSYGSQLRVVRDKINL